MGDQYHPLSVRSPSFCLGSSIGEPCTSQKDPKRATRVKECQGNVKDVKNRRNGLVPLGLLRRTCLQPIAIATSCNLTGQGMTGYGFNMGWRQNKRHGCESEGFGLRFCL